MSPSSFYYSCQDKIKESFATGIGVYLTRKVYPEYSRQYFGNYTGIIEDLMDTDGVTSHNVGSHIEEVSGFTIAEIEDAIVNVTTWDGWRDNIISRYPYNPSVGEVSNLFTLW